MNSSKKILKYSLLAGSVYFLCVSIAHFFDIKIPGLFIYYNVPSHQYQDRIISFLAFGWSAFFYVASKSRDAVYPLLVASFVALFGLIQINLSADYGIGVITSASSAPFWLQTLLLAIYVSWLVLFYIKSHKKKQNERKREPQDE